MSKNEGKLVKNGFFSVSADRELNGTLSLDGCSSLLHLWSHDLFDINLPERNTITGILENQQKVSLINCVNAGVSRSFGRVGVSQHYNFFPHYVVVGNRHFSHSEKFISRVSIVVDDTSVLFHDRFSFGTNIVKSSEIETLSSLETFDNRSFNENSIIAYYTGKEEIFSADTTIGNVSARNAVSFNFGGPTGAHIDNKIFVRLSFPDLVDVAEMNQRIQKVLRFLEIIAGRPQNLLKVNIIDMDQDPPTSFDVYINMQSNWDRETGNREPHFHDILIDAVAQPTKFAELICAWLERDESWRIARARFSTAWGKQRNYDPDRLIAAANMFDLLPKEALPENVPLSSELEEAIQESIRLFEGLLQGEEIDSVRNALGRIKHLPLKQKIRHRSRVLTNLIGPYIPDIDLVTDAAVNLRNFYVHGNGRKRDKLGQFQTFLTDTLEFVFCASDLAELGWDVASWCRNPKGAGHPFCVYLQNYQDELSKLKARDGI